MSGERKSHISARQIRAARALMDWSQEDLAEASGLSVATIRKLELGNISPRGKTMDSLEGAFEGAGLEFWEPNGVRQRPEEIVVYEGIEEMGGFFDDVYKTAAMPNSDIVIVCPDADAFAREFTIERRIDHIKKMTAIKDKVTIKCIITENKDILPAPAYCEYRWLSKNFVDSVPFYIYGDKYAIIRSNVKYDASKIIVIQSREVADMFRNQFYSMWDKAVQLNEIGKTVQPEK